jgi:anti-sigma factor RsiW
MLMIGHVAETDLALYGSGDFPLFRRLAVRLHTKRCQRCRVRLDQYRADLRSIQEAADEMPKGVHWNRLASEMKANIRVGLAAGECVAPRPHRSAVFGWLPAAIAAGFVALLVTGWWLNMPASDTQSLGRAMRSIWNQGTSIRPAGPVYERGPMVEATPYGIALYENGSSLGVSQGKAEPVNVSVSAQGSASARYVDADTGQMTITSVYVQ